jgi:tRNA A-37 threonylcarbamoyl transferase component Bud32
MTDAPVKPDSPFKPNHKQLQDLHSALIMAYANVDQFRQVLLQDLPLLAANVTFLQSAKSVVFDALEHVDSDGVDWAQFLRVVRNGQPDSAVLSAVVDRILLSGALKGLDGTFDQVSGLKDAESSAFGACMPPFIEDPDWREPPEKEGARVAWYAGRLVDAGRLARPGAIPVLLFVESIRLAVAPTSKATADQLGQWIEKTAETLAVNKADQEQIRKFTREHAARPGVPAAPVPTDRYVMISKIDEGGMGVVWRARDQHLKVDVALKVIKSEFSDNPEWVRRFEREARISAQLAHPLIIPVHDTGKFPDGRPYLTMKLVDGQNFEAWLNKPDPTGQNLIPLVRIFRQACRAVAFAHSRGVIHRDLKPKNIMVGAHDEVLVMDWGLAKRIDVVDTESVNTQEFVSAQSANDRQDDDEKTQAGTAFGSYPYMPPEQAKGEVEKVDKRSDVFSLGAVLCHILTGQPPYMGGEVTARKRAETADLKPALQRLRTCGKDPALIALAEQCLREDKSERPADAAALVAELNLCLHPRARIVFERPTGLRAVARRFPLLSMFAVGLTPNLLAMLFSHVYHKTELAPEVFDRYQRFNLGITGTCTAFGVLAFVMLAWPVVRGLKRLRGGHGLPAQEVIRVRIRSLRLGFYGAWIGLLLWLVASLFHTIALQDTSLLMHFLKLLALCGLTASAYPFFGGTALAIWTLYPAFLTRGQRGEAADENELWRLEPWLLRFRAMAVLVPVLSVAILGKSSAGWIVYVLCAAAFVGFAMAEWLHGWIKYTLADLTRVLFPRDSVTPDATPYSPRNG